MATADLLLEAVKRGDVAAVRDVLARDPEAATSRGETGASPIQEAAYRNADEILSLLLDRRPLDIFEASFLGRLARVSAIIEVDPGQVNARSYDGWTPLHAAGFSGHRELAERLLAAGADVEARSSNYMANTPLHATIAGRQDLSTVELLLAWGADVNARGAGGYTPLHIAASRGNLPIIDLLLSRGADAHTAAEDGQTPEAAATSHGHTAAADRLRP